MHGATLTDVIRTAWEHGIATKGDYARANANTVAMAASEGLITTITTPGVYSTRWKPTPLGLTFLQENP